MAQPGIFDYIREAFRVPYNLILMSGGLLAGVVSLHPLAVWPLAAAIEIVYLLTLAHNPRFQRVVQARSQGRQLADSGEVAAQLVATLSADRRQRFAGVRERCLELQRSLANSGVGNTAANDHVLGALLDDQQTDSVNKLLWVFLRTLAYEQALAGFCGAVRRKEIADSLAQAQGELQQTTLSDSMRAAYGENAEVLQKRLQNLEKAQENLESLRARLSRIENSILLIQEQALTRSDPAFIEAEVKAATAGLSSSEEMLKLMELPSLQPVPGGPTPEFLSSSSSSGRAREKA
ncbi:MAG TPA: hypothetical protein VOA87_03890 [Thermoanaerobaculia bacterium]|nr:hypothetical protein [Thermoanaerobaculia bacterium]